VLFRGFVEEVLSVVMVVGCVGLEDILMEFYHL
jgi:hypothetical protein